jgi:leucyl-tRNA synthetase
MILGPDHRKMSKRWGNVINPLDVIQEYGADTLRMYEMFMGPLDQMKPWNVSAVAGVYRFLSRVWNMAQARITSSLRETNAVSDEAISRKDVLIALHKMIKKVTEDIPELKFNTAIAECMIFMNAWEKAGAEALSKVDLEKFLLILAPYAPYITEELWSLLGHPDSIHTAQWPEYDPSLLVTDSLEMPVQVNGKVRGTITVSQTDVVNEEVVQKIAKENPVVVKHITGTIVKVIYVPGKILNIITRA